MNGRGPIMNGRGPIMDEIVDGRTMHGVNASMLNNTDIADNFWKPIIFLGAFFIALIIIYIISYLVEMRDLRQTKQTLLLDEAVNISHQSYILSVS